MLRYESIEVLAGRHHEENGYRSTRSLRVILLQQKTRNDIMIGTVQFLTIFYRIDLIETLTIPVGAALHA
jgi:hypothetical protein